MKANSHSIACLSNLFKMLQLQIKSFDDLTLNELHELLQLRSEVFVVEQNCVYQDIDGKDKEAMHLLGQDKSGLVAYTRIFPPGVYYNEASIGRVLVKRSERQHGYGYRIMEASIKAIFEHYGTCGIKISAQKYLEKFYGNLGFKPVGDDYLEDGIPHVAMVKI